MKIKVHRLVKVCIVDTYEIEDNSEEKIKEAINYEILPVDNDELWETSIPLGPVEVYDENNNFIFEDNE